MEIEDTLREAVNLIDEEGCYWAGQFADTYAQAHIARFHDNSLEPIFQAMQNIQMDVWNICTLVTRMEWFRALAIQDKSLRDSFYWMLFTSVDIEHFHVELRSILDYVANILVTVANEPGKVKKKSFDKLYHWLNKKPSRKDILGKEVSDLVLSAAWYSDLRGIRDAILHHGAMTGVFGEPENGILFQVHNRGFRRLINIDSLMWNENVVNFQLYAGLYFARVIVLLEQLGRLLADLLKDRILQPSSCRDTKFNYAGFDILRNWMSRLLDKLNMATKG